MKLARLVDPKFHSALDKLATQSLPLKVAFRLKGITKTVREEFTKYEELRMDAIKKYGKKSEDGNLVLDASGNAQFEPEALQEFAKEVGSLANEEVELQTIKLSELGDKITMTLEEIEWLDGLVVED